MHCWDSQDAYLMPDHNNNNNNNNNNQLYLMRVTLDSTSTEELVALDPNNYYNKLLSCILTLSQAHEVSIPILE